MSKEIESISAALFDKIRSRFANVTLGDETAKAETDPSEARFFNFVYSSKDGAEFGTVTISLIDETSLKVYYGQNISSEMDREQRKEWYEFLRNLRLFAKRNLLTFDTRDINKSNLDLKDVKQQARVDDVSTVDNISMTESRLYGTPGRPYNSFADKGATKILIRHANRVDDEVRGARARRIEEIFLETERGERFLLNHKNLHGAYAMAENLNAGGSMYDDRAKHIESLIAEMSAMRHFVRSTKHRQFEDEETADMTRSAVHHYDQIKRQLRQMRGARGYKSYFETWQPDRSVVEDEVDVDALRERFVKKVYDDRFTDALPIVYKAHKKYKRESADTLSAELEEWADDVMAESNWLKPENDDQHKAVVELLKTPVPVGIGGVDAISAIGKLIGDDELNDAITQLSDSQGPDADATPLIKSWLETNMPKLFAQVSAELQQTGRDQQTNFAQPTSPQPTNANEYGSTTEHPNVSNMTMEEADSLDFIRSLAGLRK
jgi:hypothetical protein